MVQNSVRQTATAPFQIPKILEFVVPAKVSPQVFVGRLADPFIFSIIRFHNEDRHG
jgi:hypothetical protein